jgi:hypothetical protein
MKDSSAKDALSYSINDNSTFAFNFDFIVAKHLHECLGFTGVHVCLFSFIAWGKELAEKGECLTANIFSVVNGVEHGKLNVWRKNIGKNPNEL